MTEADRQALQALENTRFTTYWLDSLDAVDDEAALERDTDCDLLVVGGGFCGLWAALQAKQQIPERDVVLIEAKSVANGASGRPAAIMSTSVMHGIDNTERIFPEDVAELERLGRENMDAFKQTIEHFQIDCDIEWGGEMKVSIGDEGLPTVEEDYQLYLKYGHDAVRLDKAGVQAEINSPIFHGGAWSRQRSGRCSARWAETRRFRLDLLPGLTHVVRTRLRLPHAKSQDGSFVEPCVRQIQPAALVETLQEGMVQSIRAAQPEADQIQRRRQHQLEPRIRLDPAGEVLG